MNPDTQPIGPLRVEPLQSDHGASMAVCHPERGIIAIIPPVNADDDPEMDDAEHESYAAPYAHLFAAAPDLLEALKGVLHAIAPYTAPGGVEDDAGRPWLTAARAAMAKAEIIDPTFSYLLPGGNNPLQMCNGDSCRKMIGEDDEDDYYGSPCGTFCHDCMHDEHAPNCETCASEFDIEVPTED